MPIYVTVLKDAHLAVPLSKVTTNGVAWSAFFYNVRARHPDNPNRPLINYDVALLVFAGSVALAALLLAGLRPGPRVH